jgi:hypothetical protein
MNPKKGYFEVWYFEFSLYFELSICGMFKIYFEIWVVPPL